MKRLKHNGYTLVLEKIRVGYKVQTDRFTRRGASNNTAMRYGYEYKIADCTLAYNTSKLLKDWKYILENLNQYKWVKPFLK